MGPLTGVRILDLTSVLMGPYATQILSDFGAEVIKIESPEGDIVRQIGPMRSPGMGAMFLNVNRGKRSVALDLKQPKGREALLKLAGTADAVIYNLRPQAMARLGLDYAALSAANPSVLYVGMFGYGQNGPYAARPAYDDLIQGAVGLASLLAIAGDGAPRYVPLTLADRVVGLMAVNAILGGLLHRQRTGEGQRIDVPMFESMASFVLGDHMGGLTFDPPLDKGGYGRLLTRHRKPYRTSDGYICALIYNDKHWDSFFKAIGQPEFLAEPRFADHSARTRHIDEIYELVGRLFLQRTTAEWQALLEAADIPVTPLNTLQTVVEDPHLQAVGFFQSLEHPTEGPIRQMNVPSAWSETQPAPGRPAPRLGENGAEVLTEAGFTAEEIRSLVDAAALHLPDSVAAAGEKETQ